MNMQKTYIQLPGRQMYDFHTQISGLVVQSYQPYYTLLPEVVFRCEYFLISSSNISKTYFFRTLAHDVFFRFNREEESIAIPEIHLKLVFLYVKLEIKDIQLWERKKFNKQSVVLLLKNGCYVRHDFCLICDQNSWKTQLK